MKRNDVVLYVQNGRTYNALVLAEAAANDKRLGKNGEPSLHLVVVFDDPVGKRIPLGELPEPTIIHDVVHASHEFDADYFHDFGPDAKSHRGHGEWEELYWSEEAAYDHLEKMNYMNSVILGLEAKLPDLPDSEKVGADMGMGISTRGMTNRRDPKLPKE